MLSTILKRFSLGCLLLVSSLAWSAETLKDAVDLKSLGQENPQEVILLMVSQPDCSFCVKVKKDHLGPMIKTDNSPPVRVININTEHEFIGFDGKRTSANEFSAAYQSQFTPTLLFVGPTGDLMHPSMIGINTAEFYDYYVDEAIRLSRQQLN